MLRNSCVFANNPTFNIENSHAGDKTNYFNFPLWTHFICHVNIPISIIGPYGQYIILEQTTISFDQIIFFPKYTFQITTFSLTMNNNTRKYSLQFMTLRTYLEIGY
jgi:hypothetical protein